MRLQAESKFSPAGVRAVLVEVFVEGVRGVGFDQFDAERLVEQAGERAGGGVELDPVELAFQDRGARSISLIRRAVGGTGIQRE